VSSLDDPEVVRREYATDAGLSGRIAAYRFAEGPDARRLLFEAVAEARPRRLLDVGCGRGEIAARFQHELGCDVVALDQSEHMVELTRARGVEAVVGDVQELPFADASFDCAVAAWMLFHVPDVDRALAELERVLVRGGRLVAVTNSADHLRELADALGVEPISRSSAFSGENGEELLLRYFGPVQRREAYGSIVFPGRAEAQAYVDASALYGGRQLPLFEGELRASRLPVVFVAEKAA
jgi:SAM-dependent methyltransferase